MRFRLALAAFAVVACGADVEGLRQHPEGPPALYGDPAAPAEKESSSPGDDDDIDQAATAAIPYDHVTQKSAHNAYERSEPLLDQLAWHHVRSLELDIHASKMGAPQLNGDWYVFHEDLPLFRNTSCDRLSDCLTQLAAFHARVPEHEVVTLWIDLKDPSAGGSNASAFDALLASKLGRENLVTPADLVARCSGAADARSAVTGACTFPTLGELRGKFLIGVTGGSACNARSNVSAYVGSAPLDRTAFRASDVGSSCPVAELDAHPDVVFFNMSWDARAAASDIRARGLVGRVYKTGFGIASPEEFDAVRALGIQHLATDKVSAEMDAWARTSNAQGFPFSCTGCASLIERGAFTSLRTTSGEIGGAADSFFFAYETDTTDATWTTLASVPSSHVDPLAKACLMARESDAPTSPFAAVCRPLDDGAPIAIVRGSESTSAVTTSAPATPGLGTETPAHLSLAVTSSGQGSKVVLSSSADGVTWTKITEARFDATKLPLRGLAASSYVRSEVRATFVDSARTTASGTRTTYGAANLGAKKAIGPGASGAARDGF